MTNINIYCSENHKLSHTYINFLVNFIRNLFAFKEYFTVTFLRFGHHPRLLLSMQIGFRNKAQMQVSIPCTNEKFYITDN